MFLEVDLALRGSPVSFVYPLDVVVEMARLMEMSVGATYPTSLPAAMPICVCAIFEFATPQAHLLPFLLFWQPIFRPPRWYWDAFFD